MATVTSYRDLEIWRMGVGLVTDVYRLTSRLPESERFNLVGQMQRAAVSVPSNIAEGWGRGRSPAQAQFIKIARGSLYELETLLEVSQALGYLGEEALGETREAIDHLGKKVNAYLTVLERNYVREELVGYGAE